MYAGHAAIALAVRARAPHVPMLALAIASFGPDIVDTALMVPRARAGMGVYSHSLLAVLVGSAIAGLLYHFLIRKPGGSIISLMWLLHLPPDLITGRKTLFVNGVLTGLDLYHLPSLDFFFESVLIIACCTIYGRAFTSDARSRKIVVQLAAGLVFLQGVADFAISQTDHLPWTPSLASGRSQSHLYAAWFSGATDSARLLHFRPQLQQRAVMETGGVRGIVTLVCLTCGKEQFFTDEVPATVACSQCSGTVFRTFGTPTEPDGAAIDAAETQARSMAYGDSSPETTLDDVRDLDNI